MRQKKIALKKPVYDIDESECGLHDDSFHPDYKKHWLNISLAVVLVCLLAISYGLGHRQGRMTGRKDAINYMMDQIHADLDQKCFDQLSKNMDKGN